MSNAFDNEGLGTRERVVARERGGPMTESPVTEVPTRAGEAGPSDGVGLGEPSRLDRSGDITRTVPAADPTMGAARVTEVPVAEVPVAGAPGVGAPVTEPVGAAPTRAARFRMSRSRGAISGVILILLGIWGAIIPFVGPYFGYAIGSQAVWSFNYGRLWLDILPGVAAILGGLTMLATRNRSIGWFGGWLAAAGGIWFVVGPEISRLWNNGTTAAGAFLGTNGLQVAEAMGYFYGLGVVVAVFAGLGLGRLAVRSWRDRERAEVALAPLPGDRAYRVGVTEPARRAS
ncbi:MAG: PRC-barrel domain-containing protein [Acidimicrobiales bacterium]